MDVLAPVLTALTAVVSIAVGLSGLLGRASTRASARFWLEAAQPLQPGSSQRRAAEVAYLVAMARLTAGARYPVSGAAVAILVIANSSALVVLPVLRSGFLFPAAPSLEPAFVVIGIIGCLGGVLGLEAWLARRRLAHHEFLGSTEASAPGRWGRIKRPLSDTLLVVCAALFTAIVIRDVVHDQAVAPPGTYNWWTQPLSVGAIGPFCAFLLALFIFLRLVRSGDRLRGLAEACPVRVAAPLRQRPQRRRRTGRRL